MLRRLPFRLVRRLVVAGMLGAVAAPMVIAAPSAAAAEKVYESETTAECVLAPGVLNEPGTLKLKVKGEGPASVKKGESFAAKNSTIAITTPEEWGKLLITLGAHRIKGFVTVAEVETENGSPSVLNIAKPPEFPTGLPIKSKVESAAVTFTVPSENRVFIAGPVTVTGESGNLVVKYDPAPGFTKVGTGSYTSTHKGIQSEVTGFTEPEPGEQVIGPLETSCTEPKAKPLATVPIVPPSAPPAVTSVTPNEVGSAGNFKVILHGSEYTEITGVKYGTVPATKIITTGTPTKGQCKVKSTTEMECLTPFHEHGEKIHTTVTNATGTSSETSADTITFWPEVYRNELAVATAHVTNFGYGQIQLESPQIQTDLECVNLGFGAGWNEAVGGGPTTGHGEIVSWWASGHAPSAEHGELASKCRFVYHGTEENQPTSPTAWATAEPALRVVDQEGIVCAEASKKELSKCPSESSERVHETVAREVSREALSLPWNIQFTEKAGTPHVRIGLPDECKGKTGAERTELSKCPETSEREAGKSPEGCNIPPSADPPGCVKVQIVSDPPLNIHMEYEGFMEPLGLNSGPNGLSPSSWEFEGHAKGEPGLRLRETPSTEGSTTGNVKILGFSGQELITVK